MESTDGKRKLPRLDLFFQYLESRKPSDRLLLYILGIVFIVATCVSLITLNNQYVSDVPTAGGRLDEGIIGTPRFVNPALALTRVDNDLVALLYSGLMKLDENGTLVPDLAESVTVSDDGLVYNVVLRGDIAFHDDSSITAEDVAYTVGLIQNPDVKSPLRGNWSGVTVEVLNTRELNLIIQDPYAPFVENLTLGIMPKHVWETLTVEELPFSQHNTEPVGSGPYAIERVDRTDSGLIKSYVLHPFSKTQPQPRISSIDLTFFQNEDDLIEAYRRGEVTSTASLSYDALDTIIEGAETVIVEEPLPRIFSVFFNQNKSAVLRDLSARRALDAAIDRTALIDEVLHGYGTPATSPLPPTELHDTEAIPESEMDSIETARSILVNGGWDENERGQWSKEIDGSETTLKVTIATTNNGTFEETAYYLERVWKELGVEVSIELYEQSDLVQTVIRPRSYEALLFGTEIGRALDLYPFWHSSQREDPGLNVALYANSTTDSLLTTARTSRDTEERFDSLNTFAEEVVREVPAIFLYSPSFVYVTDNDVHTAEMNGIARPHERFSNIAEWFMREDSVWHIFAYQQH